MLRMIAGVVRSFCTCAGPRLHSCRQYVDTRPQDQLDSSDGTTWGTASEIQKGSKPDWAAPSCTSPVNALTADYTSERIAWNTFKPRLSFRVLEPLAGTLMPVLLSFLHAGIAGKEPFLAQP